MQRVENESPENSSNRVTSKSLSVSSTEGGTNKGTWYVNHLVALPWMLGEMARDIDKWFKANQGWALNRIETISIQDEDRKKRFLKGDFPSREDDRVELDFIYQGANPSRRLFGLGGINLMGILADRKKTNPQYELDRELELVPSQVGKVRPLEKAETYANYPFYYDRVALLVENATKQNGSTPTNPSNEVVVRVSLGNLGDYLMRKSDAYGGKIASLIHNLQQSQKPA